MGGGGGAPKPVCQLRSQLTAISKILSKALPKINRQRLALPPLATPISPPPRPSSNQRPRSSPGAPPPTAVSHDRGLERVCGLPRNAALVEGVTRWEGTEPQARRNGGPPGSSLRGQCPLLYSYQAVCFQSPRCLFILPGRKAPSRRHLA